MTFKSFQDKIQNTLGNKLKLKINDNRSTMLSVRWEPDCTRVSLHRMFLQAPQNVMDALSCYIRQEKSIIPQTVKKFIETNLKKLDYTHHLARYKLYSQGNVYNLKKIYEELNKEYFQNKLNLAITWFGKHHQRNKSRVTFGLYYDPLKLIKINRLLDSPAFPDYFIGYVVYHEMLHHVCPPYIDKNGMNRVHSKEFKLQEEKYLYYDLAQNWLREHQNHFFAGIF